MYSCEDMSAPGVRAWGTRCSLAQSGPNSAASFCRFCVAASRIEYT